MNITLVGPNGRMGSAIQGCIKDPDSDIRIVGRIHKEDSAPQLWCGPLSKADVVIDFSTPTITTALVEQCVIDKKRLVIGTTGQTPEQNAHIQKGAESIPIVRASNFSTGMNTLFSLVAQAAELLGDNFEAEVMEVHHRFKKDAPSGSAKTLAAIVAKARERNVDDIVRNGRHGTELRRHLDEIGVHALRGGDVVGEHTVFFFADGERIELTHRVSNRAAFALGALRAARWLLDKPAGLYSMKDVLGLNGK